MRIALVNSPFGVVEQLVLHALVAGESVLRVGSRPLELTPTKRTWSPNMACAAAKAGSSRLHGAHVENQKLTTSGAPDELGGREASRR